MQIQLPENVELILNRLEAGGHRADIVGGPVRDFLLGKIPDDYDITTSSSPEETKRIFSDFRTVDTGIKHGTVSVILDGAQYEVTTYRIDGEYKDSRHPESVTFTKNIEEDLRRRDFTMNAIAYSPKHGITDPYGGREDTANGVIRAVGEPELRFTEDALRILRGVRFASTLGFRIDVNTREAMLKTRHLLKNVSVERIYVELKKAVSGKNAYKTLMSFSEIILEIIPELDGFVLPDEMIFDASDYIPRLLSLFYLNSKDPKVSFDAAMRRLHTDSRIREIGASVLSLVDSSDIESDTGLKRVLRDVGADGAKILVDMKFLLGQASIASRGKLEELLRLDVAYRVSDLKINGSALISLGARGRQVGDILASLLDSVICGDLENEEGVLLSAAKSLV